MLWGYGYESQTGDQVDVDISGPSGYAFHHETRIEKGRALFYLSSGKKAPAGGLAPGRYRATATYLRGAMPLGTLTTEVEIAP